MAGKNDWDQAETNTNPTNFLSLLSLTGGQHGYVGPRLRHLVGQVGVPPTKVKNIKIGLPPKGGFGILSSHHITKFKNDQRDRPMSEVSE